MRSFIKRIFSGRNLPLKISIPPVSSLWTGELAAMPDVSELIRQGCIGQAESLADEAYRIAPRSKSTLMGMARVAEACGRWSEAIGWIERAGWDSETQWQKDVEICKILLKATKYEQAFRTLTRMLDNRKDESNEADVHFWSSPFLESFRDTIFFQSLCVRFIDFALRDIRLHGENTIPLRIQARVAMAQDRLEDTRAFLLKAVMIKPNDDILQSELHAAEQGIAFLAEKTACIAAYRAYEWDDTIQELGERFKSSLPSARFVVLADETRRAVDCGAWEKISHTSDTESLGLINHPPQESLWFNCDYGIYILNHRFPDAEYYILSESDLAVNVDLEPVLLEIRERGLDFVAHGIDASDTIWQWHQSGAGISENLWRSLLFFMVVSRRAAEYLFRSRCDQGKAFRDGTLKAWPFTEVFVPTMLRNHPDMKIGHLSDFVDTSRLQFRPRYSITDPRAASPGSMVHSVISNRRFLAEVILQSQPRDYFEVGSVLRDRLQREPQDDVWHALHDAFTQTGDNYAITMLDRQLGVAHEDLAYCKPSNSSSVSAWSARKITSEDAARANGPNVADVYAFHTDMEENPWWMVDLMEIFLVERMEITNRTGFEERFIDFSIESSEDEKIWISRYVHEGASPISSDDDQPWRLLFPVGFIARFVRVRINGKGVLHLRRVRVFGCRTDAAVIVDN